MATLQERIDAIRKLTMAAAAPSMTPEPRKPRGSKLKEEKPEEVIPDVRELIAGEEALAEFEKLAGEHLLMGRTQAKAKKQKDIIGGTLKKYCNDYSLRKAMVVGARLSYYPTNRTSVDVDALRHALLAAGLHPTKIAVIVTSCVRVTPSWTLKITAPGEEEDE